MATVQVKHVPPEVHTELRRRAARTGISLQDYVLHLLVRETEHPPIDEVFEEIERRARDGDASDLDPDDVVAIIRAHRDAE